MRDTALDSLLHAEVLVASSKTNASVADDFIWFLCCVVVMKWVVVMVWLL